MLLLFLHCCLFIKHVDRLPLIAGFSSSPHALLSLAAAWTLSHRQLQILTMLVNFDVRLGNLQIRFEIMYMWVKTYT